VVRVARSSRGSGDRGVDGVENFAQFEHKRTLFIMDNTVIFINIRGSCYSRGLGSGLKPKLTLSTGFKLGMKRQRVEQ